MARAKSAESRGSLENRLAEAVSHAAIGKGEWSAVAALLRTGAGVENPGSRPGPLVQLALAPAPVLRLAIQSGAAVNPRFRKELPVVRAVRANLPANVRLLLAAGARPNDREDPRIGESAVDAWASWGLCRWTDQDRAAKAAILKALVGAGAKLDRPGGMENATPLWRLLLWHCVGNDPADASPPIASADQFSRCEADMAVMLLRHGVDANAICPFAPEVSGGRIPKGATPLFIRPIASGTLHRALLRAGADPMRRDAGKRTAPEFLEAYHASLIEDRARAGSQMPAKRTPNEPPLFPDDPAVVDGLVRAMRRRTTHENAKPIARAANGRTIRRRVGKDRAATSRSGH